jgi:hypothetical protein
MQNRNYWRSARVVDRKGNTTEMKGWIYPGLLSKEMRPSMVFLCDRIFPLLLAIPMVPQLLKKHYDFKVCVYIYIYIYIYDEVEEIFDSTFVSHGVEFHDSVSHDKIQFTDGVSECHNHNYGFYYYR